MSINPDISALIFGSEMPVSGNFEKYFDWKILIILSSIFFSFQIKCLFIDGILDDDGIAIMMKTNMKTSMR